MDEYEEMIRSLKGEEETTPSTIFIVFVHETHVGKHFQSAHATKASAEQYIADNSLMFIYDTPEIVEVPLHG